MLEHAVLCLVKGPAIGLSSQRRCPDALGSQMKIEWINRCQLHDEDGEQDGHIECCWQFAMAVLKYMRRADNSANSCTVRCRRSCGACDAQEAECDSGWG